MKYYIIDCDGLFMPLEDLQIVATEIEDFTEADAQAAALSCGVYLVAETDLDDIEYGDVYVKHLRVYCREDYEDPEPINIDSDEGFDPYSGQFTNDC